MSIRIGTHGEARNNRLFWTVPNGATVRAKFLADHKHVISGEFCSTFAPDDTELIWAHCGDDDPGTDIGVKPRFSLLVPMLVKVGDEKITRIVRLPKSVMRQIDSLSVTYPTIRGLIVDITRSDNGKWAEYTIASTGKISPVTDFDQDEWVQSMLDKIFVGDADAVRTYLINNGIKLLVNNASVVEEDL